MQLELTNILLKVSSNNYGIHCMQSLEIPRVLENSASFFESIVRYFWLSWIGHLPGMIKFHSFSHVRSQNCLCCPPHTGWQKLCGGTGGGPPPKSFDSDKNFKPEHTLFCRKLRFVAIYALFLEIIGHKKCLFGYKQCFLGKKCTITWYILHILLS